MTKTRRRLQRRKQQAEAGDIVLLCGDESEALPTSPASGRRPGRFCRFPHQDSPSNRSSWWRSMVRYTPQATRGRAGGTCPMAHRRVVAKACAITEQHRTRQRPTGLARSQATSSCASDVRRSRCSQNGNLLRRPCTQSAARSRDVGQDTKPGLVPWIDNRCAWAPKYRDYRARPMASCGRRGQPFAIWQLISRGRLGPLTLYVVRMRDRLRCVRGKPPFNPQALIGGIIETAIVPPIR